MIAREALGAHRAELTIQTGPELLQTHPSTLTRAGHRGRRTTYSRTMIPGTGSGALDAVLQFGIAAALLVTIIVLIKNYRDR